MGRSFKKVPRIKRWLYKQETLEQRLLRYKYDLDRNEKLKNNSRKWNLRNSI